LLAKGAVGHNHFWFRKYAIEQALNARDWDVADRHAGALAARMADGPLPYSDMIVQRGRILARIGRGAATGEDERTLADLRLEAAQADFQIDALGEALRAG
jgi:hypothetical protein